MIRKGVRKLLRQLGYALPQKRRGLAADVQRLLATYVDHDRKAEIDWTDPAQRAAQLKVLVQDAEATLELAAEHSDDADVRSTGWLLTKILGDDVVTDEHGDPPIGHGTAPDRTLSVTDPEMRYGHKSKAFRFEGFKVQVTTEPISELIVDIADIPAPGRDSQYLSAMVERVEEHAGVEIERVIGDGVHGSGPNQAWCAEHAPHPIDLVAPLAQPPDPAVHKAAFDLDLKRGQATCPQEQTVIGKAGPREQGRPTWLFYFARQVCELCPLLARCVHSKTAARTVRTDPYESYLRAARQRQKTAKFQELYRVRSRVERKQAQLVHHGIRQTRYLGQRKRHLQRLWTGAVVNLKRLFTLGERAGQGRCALFARMEPPPLGSAVR